MLIEPTKFARLGPTTARNWNQLQYGEVANKTCNTTTKGVNWFRTYTNLQANEKMAMMMTGYIEIYTQLTLYRGAMEIDPPISCPAAGSGLSWEATVEGGIEAIVIRNAASTQNFTVMVSPESDSNSVANLMLFSLFRIGGSVYVDASNPNPVALPPNFVGTLPPGSPQSGAATPSVGSDASQIQAAVVCVLVAILAVLALAAW